MNVRGKKVERAAWNHRTLVASRRAVYFRLDYEGAALRGRSSPRYTSRKKEGIKMHAHAYGAQAQRAMCDAPIIMIVMCGSARRGRRRGPPCEEMRDHCRGREPSSVVEVLCQ